jgi:hypothetical protein
MATREDIRQGLLHRLASEIKEAPACVVPKPGFIACVLCDYRAKQWTLCEVKADAFMKIYENTILLYELPLADGDYAGVQKRILSASRTLCRWVREDVDHLDVTLAWFDYLAGNFGPSPNFLTDTLQQFIKTSGRGAIVGITDGKEIVCRPALFLPEGSA